MKPNACTCVSEILHRAGVPFCASCGSPIMLGAAADRPEFYSTSAPEQYPPDCARKKNPRRVARERIRAVSGHERIGKGRETQWRVSRALYEAHHVRRAPTAATSDDEAMAEKALTDSGWRETRRAI